MFAVTIFVATALLVLFAIVHWYRKFKKMMVIYDALPGPRNPHWLLGHLKEFPSENEDGVNYFLEQCRKYPLLYRWWVGRFMCFAIFHHPESVKILLKSSAPKPMNVGTIYQYGLKWLGEGLLLANGDRWARSRRLLTPAFHFDILIPYVNIHNQCTDALLDKLQRVCEENETFEAFEEVGLCSLDIICQCIFSFKTDCQTVRDGHPYVKAVHRLSEIWVQRSFNFFAMMDFIFFNFLPDGWEFKRKCDYVHNVADAVIQQRKETIAKEGFPDGTDKKRYLDFVDILLSAKDENGQGMSDLDIRSEVDTFLFEGHDTTTSAVSGTLLCLAQHPEVQDKVRAEVTELLRGRDTDNIEWSDLPKLEYLTMCIKEALRYYTPVHAIQRELTEDLHVQGHFVPKGTFTIINIHNLHHNPAVWGENHNEFKPERFTFENTRNMDPFAFIPFSAGKRNCIGQNFAMMEMKIMIARIIHRFKLETIPGFAYKKKMGVIMRAENGIVLKPTLVK